MSTTELQRPLHPIYPGTRVSVGHEFGNVGEVRIGLHPLTGVKTYCKYLIVFDGGYSAIIDQWWVMPL